MRARSESAKSGHRPNLFDHLIGAEQKGGRHQIFPIALVVVMFTIVTNFSTLFDWDVSGFCAHERSMTSPT